MTRLVLFDVGKVLIDFDFAIAVRRLRDLFPVNLAKMIAFFRNSPLVENWDRGLVSPEYFFREVRREMNLPIEMERFAGIWNEIFTEKVDVISLALSLKKNYKVVLLSNTNPWHASHLRKNYPWIKLFDAFVASCEVSLLKPDPEIFKLALRKANVEPGEAFYIDDAPENVRAAKKLGIDSHRFRNFEGLMREVKKRRLKCGRKVLYEFAPCTSSLKTKE
jgi:putative hydrolase of the HAD superfamily